MRFTSCLFFIFLTTNFISQNNFARHVNPFIGTGGHGHTFPGAVLPNGMVQLSPDTRINGSWDGCSGYHYSDSVIYGFSHTHLSGTGCSDWGDILVMPITGLSTIDPKIYSSKFAHAREKAVAGAYSVTLQKHGIDAELTVTPRIGIHRYTYASTATEGKIIVDLLHRDKTLKCDLKLVDGNTVVGYRISEAWAKEQHVYFAMRFDRKIKKTELASGKKLYITRDQIKGRIEGACFTFNLDDKKSVMVKVGISLVSTEGALKNLEAEATHWDYGRYSLSANSVWDKQLQKIEVNDPDQDKLAVFYTALYHCFIHPSLNMDVNSEYRGRNNQMYTTGTSTYYSVFSLWDTYRALHPLYNLIDQRRSSDFINTFLLQYQASGRLPMWELSSNETDCMIGFHAVSVIADALAKNVKGLDAPSLYEAARAAASYSAFGIPRFNKNFYLEVNDENESVSKSLEYGYDNFCLAQIARKAGKAEDENAYLKRSLSYRNLFDAATGCMRPRKNGNFLSPFDPAEINNHFTEGNSWQYSFYVPHDVPGFVKLHGNKEILEKKLDALFTASQKTTGREQADVTGLIGQYAHGNEPSHHMTYLYSAIGKPEKTASMVTRICKEFYKNAPDGLIGNEDCGQMSAWFVFSALGFYPVCPGSDQYVIGQPQFNDIKINFEDGNNLLIVSDARGRNVASLRFNGQPQKHSTIKHTDLMRGGKLEFVYEDDGGEKFGSPDPMLPAVNLELVPAPLIVSKQQTFNDKMEISLQLINTYPLICFYTVDGSEPVVTSPVYRAPFTIDSSCTVKAKVFSNTASSAVTTARFQKITHQYSITIRSASRPEYSAEGPQSLMDGQRGDSDWRKGNWLGFQGQDLEVLVDLGSEKEISFLSLGCLQDSKSWILFPKKVTFSSSVDGLSYLPVVTIPGITKPLDEKVQAMNFEKKLPAKIKARYIKVNAQYFGKLPPSHIGAGGESYIFVDELEVK